MEKLRVFLEALQINTNQNPKVEENEWMKKKIKESLPHQFSCLRMIVSLVAC